MGVNILILIPLLMVITYLGFFLRQLWLEKNNISSQIVFSEEVEISPNQVVISEESEVIVSKKNAPRKKNFGILLLAYIALLIGMLSILIYRDIKQLGFINLSKFRIDILLSVLISPLVFQGMLANYPNMESLRWYYVLLNGYQSGFFWQTIFGEISSRLD